MWSGCSLRVAGLRSVLALTCLGAIGAAVLPGPARSAAPGTGMASSESARMPKAAVPAQPAGVVRFSSPVVPRLGTEPGRMVAVDLNADAKADLAAVDWSSDTVSVLLGTGTGGFRRRIAYRTARHPAGIGVGDIDGDGDPDVATASADSGGTISLFVNDGSGRLRRARRYATGFKAWGVAVSDVDGDGIVDLVSAHLGRKPLAVLLGEGAGRFRITHQYTGAGARALALADFNADGKLDVALPTTRGRVAVRLGRGDGAFGPVRAYRSGGDLWGIAVADLNQDDKADIAVADYGGGNVWVHLGVGDGTFSPRVRYRMGDGQVENVLVADFDRDGMLDIAAPEDGAVDEADFSGALVRRGRGDGTFLAPEEIAANLGVPTVGGAVADFNRDGLPDLAFSEGTDLIGYDYDPPPSHFAYVFLNWTGQAAPPCAAPDLLRWATVSDARRELRHAGCTLGHVRRAYARRVRKGRVISQHPAANTVRPSHTPVNLVISRGRRR